MRCCEMLWVPPYASCRNKNGIKFQRNACIGLVRGLVLICFDSFHHMHRSSTVLFCRRHMAWTCTFKPLHYGMETFSLGGSLSVIKTLAKAFLTLQNGMPGWILGSCLTPPLGFLTGWFPRGWSNWGTLAVWGHHKTEVSVGEGWERSFGRLGP